jgi:hypothetical protein
MNELKIDLGCGSNKREGFIGVDIIQMKGVDIVYDLKQRWPWQDNSVDEAHCSHYVEHLTGFERVHFANELYRVMKKGAKCTIITPHWASCRAYGDPTHAWPPVSEFWYFYLSKEWRLGSEEKKLGANAPHTDASFVPNLFNCDFDATYGYSQHPTLSVRNLEFQQFALQFYKEAAMDLIATIIKK